MSESSTDSEMEEWEWDNHADGHNTTITAEGISRVSYVLWNMLTASFGAMAVFTCNGTSRCHFNDSAKAMKFALALTIVPNAPSIVNMKEETQQQFEAASQQIRATIIPGQYHCEEYSRF